jgi:hypothetical protein
MLPSHPKASEVVIERGHAQAMVEAASTKLTRAILDFESIGVACALAAPEKLYEAQELMMTAMTALTSATLDFEALADACARALDQEQPAIMPTEGDGRR